MIKERITEKMASHAKREVSDKVVETILDNADSTHSGAAILPSWYVSELDITRNRPYESLSAEEQTDFVLRARGFVKSLAKAIHDEGLEWLATSTGYKAETTYWTYYIDIKTSVNLSVEYAKDFDSEYFPQVDEGINHKSFDVAARAALKHHHRALGGLMLL